VGNHYGGTIFLQRLRIYSTNMPRPACWSCRFAGCAGIGCRRDDLCGAPCRIDGTDFRLSLDWKEAMRFLGEQTDSFRTEQQEEFDSFRKEQKNDLDRSGKEFDSFRKEQTEHFAT
jgi:hypothetical protein